MVHIALTPWSRVFNEKENMFLRKFSHFVCLGKFCKIKNESLAKILKKKCKNFAKK